MPRRLAPGDVDNELGEDLRGIRTALERIAEVLELALRPPPAPPADAPCSHPLEARTNYGWTKGVEDWECRRCGYRTVPPAV